jgi:ribosome-binding ATPase YchF (GTP1/OBG family)
LTAIKETLGKGEIPKDTLPDLPLLSAKKEIVVLNMDEQGKFKGDFDAYKLSVKLEEALLDFAENEQQELRKEAGLALDGSAGLLKMCMKELSVILFYTIKGDETRSWPTKENTKVVDAAGMIHTDMKDGFIKAEVLGYEDFIRSGGFAEAQRSGGTKIEGKDYCVRDGDIVLIKFRAP